ncbi:DUF4957 domain-containing protein [Niabella hirudinis]|uniref:DUF4957 domain-containing protein n=1 Tax=Niabella hirudinis TaxID=1285929 RepID=UPI003EB6BDE0
MSNRSVIKYLFLLTAVAAVVVSSCKKEWKAELDGDAPRLFRPVIKGSLNAPGNYIDVAWQKSIETNQYKVELSIDSFKTVVKTQEVSDTTTVTIEDLLWEQLYQVRVTALDPAVASRNSYPADFGAIKTPRFPTIVQNPVSSDAGWTTILFKWRNEGDAVTLVKVIKTDDNTTVKQITLASADITNAYVLIEGLKAATAYRVELYSGTKFRGSNDYTTREEITGEVVDLQSIDPATVNLSTVVESAVAGTTIILKRGAVYEITAALNISKSVTIMSGADPLVSEKAKIAITGTSNFSIPGGSNIAKAAFLDLELYTNDASGKYLFNPSGATINIDELLFDNCIIHDLRGVTRFRGAITIGQYSIENSIVYNVGGYGVVTIDDATAKVTNFTFNNSTLYNADKLFTSKNNMAGKIVVSNSTFYNAILSPNYIIDFNGTTLYPAGGIDFNNIVLGRARGTNATPPVYDIRGIRANPAVVITSGNNFTASDFVWRSDASAILPGYTTYTKSSTDIFLSPDNGIFIIKDNGFPGKETAGDPRWRL